MHDIRLTNIRQHLNFPEEHNLTIKTFYKSSSILLLCFVRIAAIFLNEGGKHGLIDQKFVLRLKHKVLEFLLPFKIGF